MILYTPMQLELVLDGMDQYQASNQREISMGSSTLIVEDNGFGRGQVVRLISTEPQDYLNPNYAPGAEFKF
ncbi:MAG: hypothetical protein FH758_00875 [Firmicutes bacterium]|nr:hypothetical protein [Bacillota bacterium]